MKAIPMNNRKTSNATPPAWEKPVGTSHSTSVISKSLRQLAPNLGVLSGDISKNPTAKVREPSQSDCVDPMQSEKDYLGSIKFGRHQWAVDRVANAF